MTRYHAESNINILLPRDLPIDSGDRQWSHPLMIPLYCFWAKSNNTTHGQFECGMTWFCFCSFTCTLRLLFHSLLERMCMWEGLFKIGRPRSRGWKNFGRRWTRCVCVCVWRGGGSWKLDNFHGCHLCIVPNADVILSVG